MGETLSTLERRINALLNKLMPQPTPLTQLPAILYDSATGQPLPTCAGLAAEWDRIGVSYKIYDFDPDELEGSEP